MTSLLLNDTRVDRNPGCQATVSALVRQLGHATRGGLATLGRGHGYAYFEDLVRHGRTPSSEAWRAAVDALAADPSLRDAIERADLVVANLEGTFHHQSIGALALGGALAVAHRMGKRVWAVNGSVEAIEPWLLHEALGPAEYLAMREPRSVAWLARHGLTAVQSADAVFLAQNFYRTAPAPGAASRAVLYTPGVVAGLGGPAAADAVLAELETLSSLGWQPVFFQLEERETALAARVAQRGWPVAGVRDVAWHAFGDYLRRFGLVVSGRYHVLIFAAMAGVPAVARPSNTSKIEGLLDLLGQPLALAHDAAELRALLSTAMPAAIDRSVIRECQRLAQRNVPPASRRSEAILVGLDWTAPAALATVLGDLYRHGPDAFETSVETAPATVQRDRYLPVRPGLMWRALFDAAGFTATSEPRLPEEDAVAVAEWPAREHWKRLNPFHDDFDSGRLCFSLQRRSGVDGVAACQAIGAMLGTRRGAGVPASRVAPDVHLVFLIASYQEFERCRVLWSDLRPGAFSVRIRVAPDDDAWLQLAGGIEEWCASQGLRCARVHRAADLDWDTPADTRRALVIASTPADPRARARSMTFIMAAHHRGWAVHSLAARVARRRRAAGSQRVAGFGLADARRTARFVGRCLSHQRARADPRTAHARHGVRPSRCALHREGCRSRARRRHGG